MLFLKAQIGPLQAEKYKTCMLAYLGLEIFADSAPRPGQSVEMWGRMSACVDYCQTVKESVFWKRKEKVGDFYKTL